MDPLTLAAGAGIAAAAAGVGNGLRLRNRLRRAEVAAARLGQELQVARRAANRDPLTGLPNRRAFLQLGAALVADPVRPAIACVVVDVDALKQVNDTHGHAAGDQLLIAIGERLARYASDRDLVARLGGDEFAGLFSSPTTGWQLLYPAADSLAELLTAPIEVAGQRLPVRAAIGAAPVHREAGLATALHHADCAMYRAKATGTGVACFTPALDDETILLPKVRPAMDAPAAGGRARGRPAARLVEAAGRPNGAPW